MDSKVAPWSSTAAVEEHDEAHGLTEMPQRMSRKRFKEICRRNAEWTLIDFNNLDADQVAFARVLMHDMKFTVGELIADRMVKRGFWARVFNL